MKKICPSFYIVFCLSSSLCVAEKSPDKCERGNFNLSVFGRRMEDEKWNTSYQLDSSSCNATDNWQFVVQQNLTDFGGMRHIHLRGFFTENANMTSGYTPTQAVVTDISQGPSLEAHSNLGGKCKENANMTSGYTPTQAVVTDISQGPSLEAHSNLGGKCKGENVTEELELQVVSRKEWRSRNSTRHIDKWDEPVDKIFFHYSDTLCLNKRICKLAMLKEQDDHIPSHGDIPYNFYSDEDGVIYEGLGWERRIGGDCSLIYFLDEGNRPSNQQLQSFTLLIAQGIKLGKISPNFTVGGESRILIQSRKWFNVIQEPELKIVSRQEWNSRQPTEEIDTWVRRTNSVYIFARDSPCFNISMCKLVMLKEQNNEIYSHGDILNNFYSGGDGLVYEGRGWDRLRDADCNLMYFLDGQNPPSLQQLQSFGLLVAQGIKLGKIHPNFEIRGESRISEISKKWFSVMKYA